MDPAIRAGSDVRRGWRPDVHVAERKLEPKLPWTADFSAGTIRFIGLAEVAGALGLVVPAATGIAPILTPLAATGLVLLMALAGATHLRRKEPASIAFNALLLIAAAVVAWGRFGPHSL